jgi:hypothetical protein
MLLDNVGWHRTKKLKWPTNISPLFIPAGCPEHIIGPDFKEIPELSKVLIVLLDRERS